uniref:hypothetical protein n=1 Tax=Methylobacterium sp. CCH5-D2 TaxID=1768765 RepID=UPI0012E35B49|nr:hypothetical protein [Methylobacterium sp. CCH5-D2]
MTTQHMQQQQQQPFGPGGDYAERLVRVERDVAGLKEGMSNLATTVDKGFRELTGDLKARSGINWAPISILVTVLGLIGTGGVAYLNAGQSRLEVAISKQELRAERFVPREDLEARFTTLGQRRDDLQRLSDARVERIERDVEALSKQVVPRGEHEQTWAGQRSRDDGLQRQLDTLRQELASLNTPRDTIQSIMRRLDEIERRRTAP